eukprot:TRINITY_DN3217_c0_g1_i1.p2 TRINITY_DN3217_c0_g1~~TRINITY_DN3217_c0_g1_i1.p2  ORF type:complete len:215 (-),score=51.33 TRINITY_DN3217_c0_g1_i1:107-751(-)
MKFAILLVCVFALAQAAPVCFPEVFTTDQVAFDPAQDDVFGSRIWFDYYNQKMRVDLDVVVVNNNFTHQRASMVFDWKKSLFYHITYFNNVANCTVAALTQPIQKQCLSKNAEHRGTVIIGGVLKAENYVEKLKTPNGKIGLDILFVDNIRVPIRAAQRKPDGTFITEEYWNFQEKVHHDAFVIPSFCKQNAAEGEFESIEAIYPGAKRSVILN